MKTLIDYKNQAQQLCSRSVQIVEKAGFSEDSGKLKAFTDEVLSKTSPQLAFYGIYNAGKSSIINAVFGEDIAAVGDIPTTSEIQEINWNNFKIVDTPGINAVNEHSMITEKEIKKSDVVLFVVADQNIEERSFYDALVRVLKSSAQVLIVLNQKDASYSLNNSEEIITLKNRIVELIRTACKKANLDTEILYNKNFHGIISVNANSARVSQKAIGETAEKLYLESNFEELIAKMQSVLDSSNGVRILCPAVDKTLETLEICAQKLRETVSSEIEKNYYNTKDAVLRRKENLFETIVNKGKLRISMLREELYNSDECGIDESEKNRLQNDLNNLIRSSIKDENVTLSSQYDVYAGKINTKKLSKDNFKIDMPEMNLSEYVVDDGAEELFKTASIFGDAAVSGIVSSAVVAPNPLSNPKILKLAFHILSHLFMRKKQLDEEERRRREDLIKETNRHNQEVEDKVNARITQMMEIIKVVNSWLYKLENSFVVNARNCVDEAFASLIKKVEDEFDTEQQKSKETEELLDEISSVISELTQFKTMISA